MDGEEDFFYFGEEGEDQTGNEKPDIEGYIWVDGLMKTSILGGIIVNIADGTSTDDTLPELGFREVFPPREACWYSGEAVILNNQYPTTFAAGRDLNDCAVRIDADYVPWEPGMYGDSFWGLTLAAHNSVTLQKHGEQLGLVPILADDKVSRVQFICMHNPLDNRCTIIRPQNTSCKIYFLKGKSEIGSSESKYRPRAEVIKKGHSVALENGDLVYVKGTYFTYAFRFFGGTKERPPMIVKGSFPAGTGQSGIIESIRTVA